MEIPREYLAYLFYTAKKRKSQLDSTLFFNLVNNRGFFNNLPTISSTLSKSWSCSFPAASSSTILRPRRRGFAFGGEISTSSTSVTAEQTATDMANGATISQSRKCFFFFFRKSNKSCVWCNFIHSPKVDGVFS